MNLKPAPSVCAKERRSRRNRASDCLSEASLSSTPAGLSTAGCPQRSEGTQTVGSPFFGLPYFGEAKKGESPAAATERHQDFAKNPGADAAQGFDRLSPNGEKQIRERAFSGSEHKFTAPSARPAGASLCSQRNCDPTPKTRLHAVSLGVFSSSQTQTPTRKRYKFNSCTWTLPVCQAFNSW